MMPSTVTPSTDLNRRRPLGGGDGAGTGAVTVDDAAMVMARLSAGAIASIEVTRMATGRKNALRLEVYGSSGAVVFDLERLDELEVYDTTSPAASAGFRRVLVTEPGHPWLDGWWPPGHIIGWEHLFTHQLNDLLVAIASGEHAHPSFAEGLAIQSVLEAVAESARSGAWQSPT